MEHIEKSIDAIAKECGVSKMTVSRALRNKTNVKPETKDAILRAAEKLGYHKKARLGRPQAMASGGRKYIEVVISSSDGKKVAFYAEILTEIEQLLAKSGLDCVVHTCNGEYDSFVILTEKLQASGAAGTIMLGDFKDEQLASLFEIAPDSILLDNPGRPSITTPYESFSFDNIEAAKIGVGHLISRGCKRIALLRGPAEHYFSREIETGYREALRNAGIACDEKLILTSDYSPETAYRLILEAYKEKLEFDGIFTNDEMALGIYRAAYDMRVRIPDELAVCGCDDMPFSRQMPPPLTSVKLDYRKMSRMVVDHILSKDRRIFSDCKIKIMPVLEIRQSS